MFEAYQIGVTLKINNLVSAQLALLSSEFKAVDAIVDRLHINLKALGAESPALRALSRSIGSTSTALDRAARSAANLQTNLAAARATAASMPAMATLGGAGAGGGAQRVLPGPAGGGSGRAGMGHGRSAGGAHGGNIHMGPGGIGIGTVGVAAGDAFVPLAVTAAGIYGGKALYESARDYETAFTRFKTLNLGEVVNKQADAFARGTRVFGVSNKDLLETLRESVGMFGNVPNALKLAPVIAQLNSANAALFGGKIGSIDAGAARAVARFNDMRGLTDSPQDFMRGLNLAQRMVTGSGGALQFTDVEQFAKRGGAAFKGLSDDGILMLSTLAQEQGGATTGTALMSLYQNLIAGRTTKKTMAALEAAGLVTLGSVSTGTVGGKKSTSTQIASIKDEKMLRENPGLWLMTYGTEAARKAGATTDSETIAFMNSLVSNRTGSNMAANFTTQSLQALRDFKQSRSAMGAEQTIDEWRKSAAGKEGEFMASWSNFKTEFGTAALPAFTNMLNNGANILRSISEFVERNSELMKWIGKAANYADKLNPTRGIPNAFDSLSTAMRQPDSWGGEGRRGARGSGGLVGSATEGGAFVGFRSVRGAPAGGTQAINNTIVMPDGRVLAKVVTDVQARDMQRPATGPRTADGRMSLRAFDTATGG